jgi:hypothetical protein
MKRNYSVWHDHQKQWNTTVIDNPTLRCQALSRAEAAGKLAERGVSNCGAFIVRDDEAGTYRQIELVDGSVKLDTEISLEELCA